MRKIGGLLLIAIAVAAVAAAADTRVSGPALGYVVESAGVRTIAGIPGAALLGPVVDFGAPVRTAAASNAAGYVLAATGDEGRVVLFRGSAAPVERAIAAPDRIIVSPAGRAALLYNSAADVLQIITGLPDRPYASEPIALPWAPAALAVSDRGSVLAGAEGALWRVGRRGDVTYAGRGQVAAISFFASAENAVWVADGTVYVRRGGIEPVADVQDAIAVQAGDGFIYVATAKSVVRIELATRAFAETPCEFAVKALDATSASGVFRLNEGRKEPLYLYDGRGAEPRLLFVPAAPAGGGAE